MNFPEFWNYGEYSSDNYGAHSMAFDDADGNRFFFSYKTLIAFRPAYNKKHGGKLIVHTNDWGTTTGKHLNWIDNGDKKNRVSDDEFKKIFNESFSDTMVV